MMYWLKIAFKNLINRPLSTLLTVLLLALGIGISSFLLIIDKQLNENFTKNLAGVDLILGAKGSPLQTVLCNLYHIDAPTGNIEIIKAKAFLNPNHPLVASSVPLLLGDSYNTFRIVGTTYNFLDFYKASVNEGNIWKKPFDAVVGYQVAVKQNLVVGSKFKSSHGLLPCEDKHDNDFTVTGILKKSGSVIDQLVLTSTQSVWYSHHHENESENTPEAPNHRETESGMEMIDSTGLELLKHEERSITSILLRFKNRNFQTLNLARNINDNTDIQASNPAIELNRLYDTMGIGEKILRYLVFLLLMVGGVSIFIALVQALKDRKYELAIMRVMGSSSLQLALLTLLESLLICFCGFLLGLVIAHCGVWLFGSYASEKYKYTFEAWHLIKEEGILSLLVAVIGIISGVFPAISAYRTDISKTLTQS
ncbi:MAG: ABC transporter permease [Saprospiraceae bacterium]|nr:ABC transporter permease [Saprospiraceae bacterium]